MPHTLCLIERRKSTVCIVKKLSISTAAAANATTAARFGFLIFLFFFYKQKLFPFIPRKLLRIIFDLNQVEVIVVRLNIRSNFRELSK